jgi:hypothetical protein
MSDVHYNPASAAFLDEIQKAKATVARLQRERKLALLAQSKERRKAGVSPKSQPKICDAELATVESDFLHGAAAIGQYTNEKTVTVYYKHRNGRYQTPEGPAVWRSGPKQLTASKRLLHLVPPYEG